MKTYTVQYQCNTSDAVRNKIVKANSIDEAEKFVRNSDNMDQVMIVRTFEHGAILRPQHTTTNFQVVKTPNTPFKV